MRSFRSICTSAAIAGLLVVAASAHASHQVTKGYLISSPVAAQASLPGGGSTIGGAWFATAAGGERPITVALNDSSGGPVSFMACQDLNGDAVCGNRDPSVGALEPRVSGCGIASDLSGSSVSFAPGMITRVFVLAATFDCPNVATSGTITVSYS